MRKFALLPLFLGLSLAQVSFGQVRDLFAEFEEEAKAPATPAVQTPAAPASSAAFLCKGEGPGKFFFEKIEEVQVLQQRGCFEFLCRIALEFLG